MKQRTRLFCIAFSLMMAASIAGFQSVAFAASIDLMMGTSGATGSWYPVGVGLSTIWNEELKNDGIHVFVQTTGGGAENIQMIKSKELDMCTLGALTVNEAYNALNNTTHLPNLRTMFAFQATSMQPVILKKHVKTGHFSDIQGLKLGVGNPGGNAEKMFNIMNQALGNFTVSPERLSPANACDAIKNGFIDGNFFTGGAPIASLIDLLATPGLEIQMLEVTPEDIDKMNAISNNMWTFGTIPAGIYDGFDKDLHVAQAYDALVCTAEVPERVVYRLLEVMFNNLEKVNAINYSMSHFKTNMALNSLACPMHPGAVKYFREKGMSIPDNLIPPEMK